MLVGAQIPRLGLLGDRGIEQSSDGMDDDICTVDLFFDAFWVHDVPLEPFDLVVLRVFVPGS